MNMLSEGLNRTWRSAQMNIGFHKDKSGKQREAAQKWQRVYSPGSGRARGVRGGQSV